MNLDHIKPWYKPPLPYKNELFSSWIARIALSYHISPMELFSKHFASYQVYNRDVDITKFDEQFWRLLTHLTQQPLKKIQSLQLLHLEGVIQEQIHTTQRNKWIMPSSGNLYNKGYKSKGLRFCSLCLKENGYYSKDTKLLFINACTRHKVYFHSHCPSCDSPVLPIRVSPPKKISQCFNCGYDLTSVSQKNVSELELQAIKFSKRVLSNNEFRHQGNKYDVLDYFTVLYILIKNLHRLFPTDPIFSKYKVDHAKKNKKLPYLFGQSPNYLSMLISIAYQVLTKGWDYELLHFLERNELMYASRLFNKRENVYYMLPEWFIQHIKQLWHSHNIIHKANNV